MQENYVIRKVAGKDVLMDAEDFHNPRIQNATLILSKDGHVYARDKKTRKTTALTRIVMNSKKGQLVDHRDRNPLNNRKNNLRIATHRQNMLNRILKSSTGFIGVSINKKKIKGKKIYCAAYYTGKGTLRHGSTSLTTGAQGRRRCFYSPFTPRGLMLAAMARDKFILENKDEEYAPLNFEIFKEEPFKSVLLESDLCEMRNTDRPR